MPVKVGQDNAYLRLQFSKSDSEQFFGVRQKYIYLKMSDTKENRAIAQHKANHINSDIYHGCFDITLARYGLGKIDSVEKVKYEAPTVQNLFAAFMNSKKEVLKTNSLAKYREIKTYYLDKMEPASIDDPLWMKRWLLEHTTPNQTKAVLVYVSSAIKWGIERGIVVGENRFKGIEKELPKFNYQENQVANPFTEDEKNQIISSFKNDDTYWYYAPFVEFLFLTGCRPSEAVGLTLRQVDLHKRKIYFDSSVTYRDGQYTRNKGSKNNSKRIFPMNTQLHDLLSKQYFNNGERIQAYFFPSLRDVFKPLHYPNFSQRAWKKIVDPIKSGTTPYCCRDTFISEQIAKGTAIAVVAKWCDNSVAIIEKYYLGDNAIAHILPA